MQPYISANNLAVVPPPRAQVSLPLEDAALNNLLTNINVQP